MTEYSVEEVREWKGIAESNANLYTKMTGAHEPWTKLAGMLADLLERIKADARPVAQGEFDAEARSHARMIHDFPRLSAFFQKHALGSKLPASCFACGHVGERAITHAELADIYVCKTCAEKIAKSPAKSAEPSTHPTTNSPEIDSKLVGGAVAQVRHFDYRGVAGHGFSQEAQMLDGAPVLPDGTLLYTAPPAQPVELPEFLKDPANVHVMMLRGAIAIPSIRSMVDLRGEVPNGEDVQLARIAELQEQVAALEAQPAERDEMSPDFTDSARAAIAWVLYHHQGGSSPIGQPLRFALGMGRHERLQDWRIAEAKRWAEHYGATTEQFHRQPAERVPDAWRQALERALPFLDDEAGKYEDDGNNEPLDAADTIRDLLTTTQQADR